MSIKRKIYITNFKAKLVLEILEGLKTINEWQVNMEFYQ
jgi:hypothetical protein